MTTTTPRIVIFDMDGTLTLPAIDFDRLRAEIGIESGTILEALETMTDDERARAHEIIEVHERIAARDSELQHGVHEVLDFLRAGGIRTAIATRNSRPSVRTVLEKHHIHVDHIHTREDGPVKPSPQPVLDICKYFQIAPESSWMVGDYVYDIQSGNAAGATTVLFAADGSAPEAVQQTDYVIRNLRELIAILNNGESK
ncbi:MAG: HAD family hydrolase [Planctomycetes bacterium]|nr:HAD family hydrolase [Planctomycetota bacterium]